MRTFFEAICRELTLGDLIGEPVPLSGGYTHRMYSLTTAHGRYAVKLLNPEIMQRFDALDNYRQAEHFEGQLEEKELPILPALRIGNRKLQCISGQYLYVFPFFEGHVLRDAEITPAHCAAMGTVLARIHAVSRHDAPAYTAVPPTDWSRLTEALLADAESRTAGERLQTALPMLAQASQAAEAASAALPREEALCHNDMDAKNVLWRGEDFRIIDLECLGYANPQQEALDLAISWAGQPVDEARFKAFLQAYLDAGGCLTAAPSVLYDSRRNYLDWLAYNARRALSDDPAERQIAREQITDTLAKLESDQHSRADILEWMQALLR